MENVVSNSERRAIANDETLAVPRISDLDALVASTSGKVEIETIEEGRDGQVVERLIQQAVLTVFKASVPTERLRDAVSDFDAEAGRVVHTGDDIPAVRFVEALGQMPALESVVLGVVGWVSGLVNAFPEENRLLWDLAKAGRYEEALKVYRWYTPLLHLDTHVKLVQYIKLAAATCGHGTETVRAPRLPLVGQEREEIVAMVRKAMQTRPTLATRK